MMIVMGKSWLLLFWLLPVLAVTGIVKQAPAWLEPHTLTMTLQPGQTLALGREALWAPQADSEHLRLRRAADGGWWLSNTAAVKQVLRRSAWGHADQSIREWPLTVGATFAMGGQQFSVLNAGASGLTLHSLGQRWQFDGIQLRREGQPLPECYETWRTRLRHRLAAMSLAGWMQRPLRLGGGVYCADRLGLADAPVDAAQIAQTRSGFVLRPGNGGKPDETAVIVAAGTADAESLWQRSILLALDDRLIVGRTQYRVTHIGDTLRWAVQARAQRWPAAAPPPNPSPAIQALWRPTAWLLPADCADMAGPLALGLSPLLLALLWPGSRRDWRRWRIGSALALAGLSLGLYGDVLAAPVLWPYLSAWAALAVWLLTVRSIWSAGLLALLTVLLGIGLATLLQLGAGATETGWMRYGGGNAALAGAFGWLAWAGLEFWRRWRPPPAMAAKLAHWTVRGLVGAALWLLTMQAIFGDEGGWHGVQPFELTKLALVTAAAWALMRPANGIPPASPHPFANGGLSAIPLTSPTPFTKRTLVGFGESATRWLRAVIPLSLLLAMSGFALLFLHDFSPLVLLLIGVLSLIWAWLRVRPQPAWRWGGMIALATLILMVIMGGRWLHERPENFPLSFQQDRIRVWVAPDQHPHSGYQLRRALEAIRAGDWRGLGWGGGVNGRVMTIPVVENDFAPAFFLNRFGGGAGLILAALQTAFILLLIGSAERAWRQGAARGEFAYFTLSGGAAMISGHLLVSWGANLGFLPVMGQPMSLLSAAGSHLTLFVLPLAALAVAVEESYVDHPS